MAREKWRFLKERDEFLGEGLKGSLTLGVMMAQRVVQAVFPLKTGLVLYRRDT